MIKCLFNVGVEKSAAGSGGRVGTILRRRIAWEGTLRGGWTNVLQQALREKGWLSEGSTPSAGSCGSGLRMVYV